MAAGTVFQVFQSDGGFLPTESHGITVSCSIVIMFLFARLSTNLRTWLLARRISRFIASIEKDLK